MASIKYQLMYGQYTSLKAKELSQTPGVVAFSGKTREIWVDGKCIAANFQGTVDDLQRQIGNLENLNEGIKGENLVVTINNLDKKVDDFVESLAASLAQAEITNTRNDGTSDLTIFGIKQENGLIAKDEEKNYVVRIQGVASDENPLVTKVYVDDQIERILGSEDLEKTLDTIKEIQEELLKDATYTVKHTVGEGETETIQVERIVTKDAEGEIVYPIEYKNGEEVVAREAKSGEITYTDGYSDLERESAIDTLMDRVTENKENIENLEAKNLVVKVSVTENETNNFVTAEDVEEEIDPFGAKTKGIKIGVEYGTFKTGHEEVHNEESMAYVNGIATVEDVQRYIEERMTWVEFNSSIEEGIELPAETEPVITTANVVITLPENGTMTVKSPVSTEKPIVVR